MDNTEHPHGSDTDSVEEYSVNTQRNDGATEVVGNADGEKKVLSRHSDPDEAEQQAQLTEQAATRHEGAAKIEEVPESYPGKGVDETKN